VLANLATLAERYITDAALYGPRELVAEFARTIRRELDLEREGRILARIAAQFAEDPTVRFPSVYGALTTPSVLTMEFLDGVKVSAVGTSKAPHSNPAVVARRGADALLTQVLVQGLFHADPHSGNILVLSGDVVAFVDFGIVGRVTRRLREQLADAIQAMWRHDAERLAEVVVAVTSPRQPVDMVELARDLEEILDVYGNLAIGEMSLGRVFNAAADTISRHRLRFQADLLLLIKAIVTIEGVGRQLDPSFKMIEHAAPIVGKLAAQQVSSAALAARAVTAGRDALGLARSLPRDMAEVARKARAGELKIQFVHRNLDYFVREMDRSSNRVSFAIVIGAIVIGSALVITTGVDPLAFGYPLLGLAGFVMAAVIGIGLAVGILRSGRL
jgi:ubiquinone biosynthesis protein